jgi:hypothetical protein
MQIKFYLGEVFGKFGINLLGHLSLLELKRKRKPKRKDFFKEKSTHAHEMMHTHIRVFQTLALMHTCTQKSYSKFWFLLNKALTWS